MDRIAGRQVELEAVERFKADLADGPAFLVIEGPAGIGKSTVWEAAVQATRTSATVLSAKPSVAESGMPWAGLIDLLDRLDVAEPGIELPGPQQRALDVVLARQEPGTIAVDELTVSLALLGTLQSLAERGPVVLAIDDIQWLDRASRSVVAFALRRLSSARVGLLATRRTEARDALAIGPAAAAADADPDPILELVRDRERARLVLGPLPDDAIGRILRERLDWAASRPVLDEICRISGGNPLYAMELGRSASQRGSTDTAISLQPLGDLEQLVRERWASLSGATQDVALAIAATGRLTWEALGSLVDGDVERSVGQAERAGFVRTLPGAVEAAHPLLAAVVYNAAAEPRRRRVHARFAELWPDSDEAPRHLALATNEPDAAVATALDAAAKRARSRGAPTIAAELYQRASELTPPSEREDRERRQIDAAMASFASGNTPRARELLERLATDPEGPRHAEAMQHLAQVTWAADGDRAGMEAFERALDAAAGKPAIEGDIHDNLAWLTCWLGDMPRAYEHVQIARQTAEQLGEPGLLARVFDKYGQIEFQIGKAPGLESSERAMAYERAAGVDVGEAALDRLVILIWSDRLDEARVLANEYLERAIRDGDERLRLDCLQRLAFVELRACNWVAAREHAEAAAEALRAAGLGTGPIRRTLALLSAHEGRLEEGRALVAEGLPGARREGAAWTVIRLLAMAGFIDLSVGDSERAAESLDEADQICERIGVEEPGIFRSQGDAAEALIAAGRLARAEEVLARFERQSGAVQRPWGLAVAARARALLQAANGDLDGALETSTAALRRGADLDQPFEFGRSLLAAGTIERRAGRRRAARAHLDEAATTFDRLGAALWAERARAEAARIPGRSASNGHLTDAEQQVAALVSEGLTNQEVAVRLFVTVRTVEANLTRIYQKLEVRSRTELSRRIGGQRSGASHGVR